MWIKVKVVSKSAASARSRTVNDISKIFFLYSVFGLHKSLQHINTHVPSSVQHAAQSHFFFSRLFSCWMTKSSVTGRSFSCSFVSVCVCWACQTGIFTLHKRAGTHRSLFSTTGCLCLFRLLWGSTCCLSVRPSVCGCWAAAAVDEGEGESWTSNCGMEFILWKNYWWFRNSIVK